MLPNVSILSEGSAEAGRFAANLGPELTRRTVQWGCSESLPSVLAQTKSSLVVSTYQTGHLVVVSAPHGQLTVSFHTFDRPMGVAVRPGWLVVGTRSQVWSLRDFPDVAARFTPPGRYDACYLTRFSHFTGDIQCHEVAWINTAPGRATPEPPGQASTPGSEGRLELWLVNTLFSCLCAATASYSFAPRWSPPFISTLAPDDRCHLNGLAVADGRPRYVTALAESNTTQGWRSLPVESGCVIDVVNNQTLCRGLIRPHSPRLVGERLFLLHSGLGQLVTVDVSNGRMQTVAQLPGYTRGLAIHDHLAFIGLSKVRNATQKAMPIGADGQDLKCGCAVVDLRTGQAVAFLDFRSGIEELFDIQLLPGIAAPFVSGPFADWAPGTHIWTVPP